MNKNKEFEYEYNPVKETIGGKKAEQVVWTTKILNTAVKALQQGKPLKSNPFCGKNTKLLKPDLVYYRTKEEVEDYKKCMDDPVYFGSKCFLKTPEGLQACVLRDYQRDYLNHIKNNRFSIFLACRQSGKSTTTAIMALWRILFGTDKTALILSKSGPAGQDLLRKIKDMYLYLPYYLKCGTYKWNQSEISFDNNSSISTESFSTTAGLGKTINFLILDEFAWCPSGDVDLFYNNIVPTITTDPTSNICIMSTQNGFNLFYKLYKGAVEGKNIYKPFKVDWWQVPDYDPKQKKWVKRTEQWKKNMIGVLGSEEDFYYQYGTQFCISSSCIVSRDTMSKLHERERLFGAYTQKEYEDAGMFFRIDHYDALYWDPDIPVKDLLEMLKKEHFLILCDLAEGGGGDYTVFHIFKINAKDSFDQIGYWRSNKIDLEHAALDLWLLFCQFFNDGRSLLSIEWNTYGALFFQYLKNFNSDSYDEEKKWRFNINGCADGIDMFNIIKYKNENIEQTAAKTAFSFSHYIPGIKFTSGNKHIACSLLKLLLEKDEIKLYDIVSDNELENFEDKNGNGSYAAKNGHDDLIMTLCQIPMVQQTIKFQSFLEEMKEEEISNINQQKLQDNDIENLYQF